MREFTSGEELIKRDGGRNDGRGFVKRSEHGGRKEPVVDSNYRGDVIREREKRIIELEDTGRKIIFIIVRIGRFVYDGESGTAEVSHFVMKECVTRQVNATNGIMIADGIEFIPGEDADALAEVEVLEGHRKITSLNSMSAITISVSDDRIRHRGGAAGFGLGFGCPGMGLAIQDLHFLGDGSNNEIKRDSLTGSLAAPVGLAPAIKNDFTASFELFTEPVGNRPPFKDFGRGGVEVVVFIVAVDSTATLADMNSFGLAAGTGLGESRVGEATDGADIGVHRFRDVRIIIRVLEFGIIEVRDANFIKIAGITALGAGLGGSITDSGFVIGFIERRIFRDAGVISEGGKDKIHFLVHIAEDFAVDELVENFLVGGGIGRIFVIVDGVKHGINFLFCM